MGHQNSILPPTSPRHRTDCHNVRGKLLYRTKSRSPCMIANSSREVTQHRRLHTSNAFAAQTRDPVRLADAQKSPAHKRWIDGCFLRRNDRRVSDFVGS